MWDGMVVGGLDAGRGKLRSLVVGRLGRDLASARLAVSVSAFHGHRFAGNQAPGGGGLLELNRTVAPVLLH
jgi:hypothetical protein